MKFTEELIKLYEAPLSDTEEQKCKNSIEMVRDALRGLGYSEGSNVIQKQYSDTYSFALEMRNDAKERTVKLLLQGSYANNTNVRLESDVDIAIIEESTFRTEYPVGADNSTYGFVDKKSESAYSKNPFKDEVQLALERKFNTDVERKNKSIKVSGNSYRVNTDTVPSMRYKNFKNRSSFRSDVYDGGIYIIPDEGNVIVNYPEEHIMNGRQKNIDTNYYYKKMVKVMKKIRYIMQDNRIAIAFDVSSFGLESLLWNIPNSEFLSWKDCRHGFMFRELLNYLDNHKYNIGTYKEANNIKLLCPDSLSTSKMQNFIASINSFYEFE